MAKCGVIIIGSLPSKREQPKASPVTEQLEMDLEGKTDSGMRFALYVEGLVKGQETMVLLTNGRGKVRYFYTYEEAMAEQTTNPLSVIVPEVDLLRRKDNDKNT